MRRFKLSRTATKAAAVVHRDAMLDREHLRKFGRDRPARSTFLFRLSAGTYAEHLEATGVALVGIDAGGEISLV